MKNKSRNFFRKHRTELLFVSVWLLLLLLKGTGYTGSTGVLLLATFSISIFYLIMSYKIFHPKGKSALAIAIIAGFAIASSLITVPFNIHLSRAEWMKILPVFNVVFTSLLIVLVSLKRIRQNKIANSLKVILLRTSITLVITCSFPLHPYLIEYSFYRNIWFFIKVSG